MRTTQALDDDQLPAGVSPADRRLHKRKPVLWSARIESRDGNTPCIILDLSAGGAKLRGSAPVSRKDHVKLVIDRFGSLRAEVMWARMGLLGLRFLDTPEQIAEIVGGKLPL